MDRKVYNEIIKEYFDITDSNTRKYLINIEEADQNQVLTSLASRLYSSIVGKVTDIDFGEIPKSKGNIENIPNYEEMFKCLTTIKELLIYYKQSTESTDILFETINNIKDSNRIWEKAFHTNSDMPVVVYNTICLSIVSATSLLISSAIEFIKDPTDNEYKIFLDKMGAMKSKDWLLFKNLRNFNKSYKKGDIQKSMLAMIDANKKINESGIENEEDAIKIISESLSGAIINRLAEKSTAYMVGACIAAGGIIIAFMVKIFLPLMNEIVSFLYSMRQSASDYFAVQSELLQLNAENLQYTYQKSDESRKKIYDRQMKIVDRMKKLSNKLMVKMKPAEKSAEKDSNDIKNNKYKIDDIQHPTSNIFY